MLPADEHEIVNRGRLGPGDMMVVDVERGSVMGTNEIRRRLAFRRRYRQLVADVVRPLADADRRGVGTLSAFRRTPVRLHAGHHRGRASSSRSRAAGRVRLLARRNRAAAQADDRRRPRGGRLDGRRRAAGGAVGAAAAVQRFLPPALRAGHQPVGRSVPRIVGHVADDDARRPRQLHRRARAASAAHRAALADSQPPRARAARPPRSALQPATIDIVFPGVRRRRGASTLRLQAIADEACAAVERGSALVDPHRPRPRAPSARRCRRCWRRRRCITRWSTAACACARASSSTPATRATRIRSACCSATAPSAVCPSLGYDTIAALAGTRSDRLRRRRRRAIASRSSAACGR